ncbi:hypothetical protein [Flavobacterium sp. NKUCC04_CG]|uniref:hypothetical protein n=1 Tax=Flavobacterium sp. NKUCC04_CG TaxID=2842121 RepID=UPI001C5AF0C7|nr:hypothetical protein [Flavobacterium sp. NKUCC04_CG]MBW3519054.1 hypothetical protein [Flavobacterium sp. NKUCC04_CG]
MKNIYAFFLLGLTLTACNNAGEDKLESLDKSAAREVVLKTVVAGDTTLHISSQKIWANNEIIATRIDTIKTATKVSSWSNDAANEGIDMTKTPIYVTVE